jgi:hypothetical protein
MSVKVGDRLFVVGGNLCQYCTVSKSGRKFFEFAEIRRKKFLAESLSEVVEYGAATYHVYKNEKDYLDQSERNSLKASLESFFRNDKHHKLSTDELKQIKSIISNHE